MASNESIDEYWSTEFTSSDRQFFRKCARMLLKRTFIVRDKDEENRKMFYFASRNSDFFSRYFSFIGFDVLIQKDAGVAMLSSNANENVSASIVVNRLGFRKDESIVLCCLWVLLSDRLQRGSLDKVIKITLSDLNMEIEKYGSRKLFDKGSLRNILRLLCEFNLIGKSGEVGDEDFTIILYPSLRFALNEIEFVSFVKDAEKRMKGNEGDVTAFGDMAAFGDSDDFDFTDSEMNSFDTKTDTEYEDQ